MTHPTPKTGKRKKQPTAQVMREQLRLAADRIITLKTLLELETRMRKAFLSGLADPPAGFLDTLIPRPRIPWYRRLWNRIRARVVEVGES